MITLTKLNGKTFVLNAMFIEQAESLPDTTITLTNGKKIVVLEPLDDVIVLVKNFYKEVSLFGDVKRDGG